MKNSELLKSRVPVIHNLTELQFQKEKLKYRLMIEEERVHGDVSVVGSAVTEAVRGMLMGVATTLLSKLIYTVFKKSG